MTLKDAGHQIIEAANGQEGLRSAKSKQVDLVLSNINMPIIDASPWLKNYALSAVTNLLPF